MNTNHMVCGDYAMQRLKQVGTIQIIIVSESRVKIRWFVELMQATLKTSSNHSNNYCCLNQEYK